MLKLQINLTFPEKCLKTWGLARIQILGLEVTVQLSPSQQIKQVSLVELQREVCGFAQIQVTCPLFCYSSDQSPSGKMSASYSPHS